MKNYVKIKHHPSRRNAMTTKELRKKYNITQQQLSDLLDIPKRTIEEWERGSRTPSDWVINLISIALESKLNT